MFIAQVAGGWAGGVSAAAYLFRVGNCVTGEAGTVRAQYCPRLQAFRSKDLESKTGNQSLEVISQERLLKSLCQDKTRCFDSKTTSGQINAKFERYHLSVKLFTH